MLTWFLRQRWLDKIAVILFALLVVALLWTALASYFLILLLGQSMRTAYPFSDPDTYWVWWVFLFDDAQPVRILLWLKISGFAAAAPFVALVLRQIMDLNRNRGPRYLRHASDGSLKPLKTGVSDNHGHASWATAAQLAARFPGRGCLIGAIKRSPHVTDLLFDDTDRGPGHNLIIAGPGSDKTTQSISRLYNWLGPRVVFDPSCEIGPVMRANLEATGHNVIELGIASGGLNILDWITISHPESNAHIRSVVEWIYNEGSTANTTGGGDRNPFWKMRGREMVTCMLAHILHAPDGAVPKTLRTLRRFVRTPEGQMPQLLAGIHRMSNSSMARDLAGSLMSMAAAETFSGIYANCSGATEWLADDAYADIVSGTSMTTAEVMDPRTVVFVQIPLRSLIATPAVGRAVMGSLFNAVFEADGAAGLERVLFQIDEAWVLGGMKEIKLCHTTARKYHGLVSTIWQSEGQLEEVWGRDGAKIMRDTSAWRSYNAIQDGSIAESLSRDIGELGVMAYSEGSNRGRAKPWGLHFGSTSSGDNTNAHELKRRLIKSDEILRAPADVMFVLARDFAQPIRCVTAPYWRYPAIAGKMDANRFAQKV